jgi:voltage-gated potassium channel
MTSDSNPTISPLQIITLILSVYVLIIMVVEVLVPLTSQVRTLLDSIDFLVCTVFMTEFFVNLHRAPSKAAFLRWGWIDFVSSIPFISSLRIGRLARIARILRVLRAFRSATVLMRYVFRRRQTNSLAAVATMSLLVLIFGAVGIVQFETAQESNIKGAGDALWWAMTTMTTVGYGDKFPVTAEGRLVAVILMVAGVGIFGVFTGYIASLFAVSETDDEKESESQILKEIRDLRQQVSQLAARIPDSQCSTGESGHSQAEEITIDTDRPQ